MSISLKEQGLRRRIGTDKLIGCYTIASNGDRMFTDIRGEQGDCVTLPGIDELKIAYMGSTLKAGEFYSFAWHLEEDNIVIDGDPEIVENDDFLKKLFDAKLSLNGSNLELTNNFQRTIFDEVTGSQHTYIYELLQNANDYPLADNKVRVNFIVTNNYLFFTHTGAPFNLRNVVGITSINQGEKKKNVDTIGYKGIGFKTVFVNNEYVYLRSADWSFRFDKEFSEEQFAGECPWALMPIPTRDDELDPEVKETLSSVSEDMRVQFALRHKSNARANLPQLDKVFSDNQILLFIPNVGSVDVFDGKNKIYNVDKDDSKWIVSDFHYPVPQQLRKWVEDNIDNGSKVPEKFKDIAKVRISFAVSRDGIKIVPVENARVYNYLPTELRLGYGFLINADFIPNGSRSGLHDVEWNNHIMEQVGIYFADWWSTFLKKEGEYDLNSVFNLLPDFISNDNYGRLFLSGFFKRIKQIPCIPALKDGDYRLCRIDEIIQDRIDFFNQGEQIISDEDFYKFYRTKLYLPHPEIRNNVKLKELIGKFGPQSNHFNTIGLERLVNNSSFTTWLSIPENNIRFNGFLISSTFIQELRERALFLRNDGHLGIASKIYANLDRYIDDLNFIEDLLPRLNDDVRVGLSKYRNWDTFEKSFMSFDTNRFSRDILEHFDKYKDWFLGIEESVNFIHFLAVTHYQGGLMDNYPLYNENGKQVKIRTDLYQSNEIGRAFSGKSWINSDWIQFVSKSYFAKDGETVSKFLDHKGIKPLRTEDTYPKFINNNNRIPIIAESIKNLENSIDFYRYLWSIQECVPFFSQEMRSQYTVLVTDGDNEEWILINQTIFKQDEDWEDLATKPWMPAEHCWALVNDYYEGLDKKEEEAFESFLSQKQVAQSCTVKGLFNSFSNAKCFGDIFAKIENVSLSREFLNFLWEYNKDTFNYTKKGDLFSVPIALLGSNTLRPLSDYANSVFIPNDELLSLYNQAWFDKDSISIISREYDSLFDNGDKRAFFSYLGIKKFNLLAYVREQILPNLDEIGGQIRARESNITFHRFFASIHSELSEKEAEPLAELPIYISSPDDENGILVEKSGNHYLPSSFLSEIINLDLVPIEILDSIHPEYIHSPEDEKYFETKLGNVAISFDGFYSYIIERLADVEDYLKEKDRNIKFWKWTLNNLEDRQLLSKLSDFPILSESGYFSKSTMLYVSNNYVADDIELFIKRFVANADFVSKEYWESDNALDWYTLFSTLGVKVSTKDILFRDVIPNLSQFKDRFIFLELAKYVDFIKSRINAKDDKMISQLSQLNLLCDDSIYRKPKEVIISGRYFDIEKETYPDIKINNLVSAYYITDCGENHNLRRQVIELMKLVGDTFKSKCENSTQLRNKKLDYFANHQSKYAFDEAHFRIIEELAEDFRFDTVGISDILEKLPPIKLKDTNGELCESSKLYFGQAYNPPCDFQGNGIVELEYLTPEYISGSHNCYRLFSFLNVNHSFKESNIPLLRNEQFAIYFWTQYVPQHQIELSGICDIEHLYKVHCIPTNGGMKRPCDLYHTANSRLNKIIEQIPGGKEKQPCINLPEWVRIGMRSRLYIDDCLEYLKIETLDYRQDVLLWLYETPEDVIQSHRREIDSYREVATWYTGAKNWVPLRSLVALEWADGSSSLKDSFGGNAFVCNPSNMPETKQVYDKICNIFRINILTEKDFSKRKSGSCEVDEKARIEIDKRLLYIAYKIDSKNWKAKYGEFHKQLFSVDLEKCEQILYYYDENINSDDIYSYIDDPRILWYVGEWDGKRFEKVLEWILNTFQLRKYGYTKASLEKMFEVNMNVYLKKKEAGSMPAEFLSMLDEADKKGLAVDKNADFEEGIGEDDNAHIEENVNHTFGHSHPQTNLDENNQSPTDDDDEIEIIEEPEIDEDSQRVTRTTDLHREESTRTRAQNNDDHERLNRNTRSNATSRPSRDSQGTISKNEESDTNNSLEGKMEEKWNNQRKKGVARPQGAGYRPKEENSDFELKGKSENKSENPDFFSGRKYNGSTTSSNIRNRSAEEMQRRHTEAQTIADSAKEQYDLYEIWHHTKPYSFKWFKYLMELQFQDKDKKLPAPVQIDFSDWTIMDEEQKLFRMISPSRNIPKWLEDAQDVKVTLLGEPSRRLECAILSVDGVGIDLLINPNDLDKINDADKIRINAQNHTNFIDSLQTSFLDLGYEDEYQLDDNLPADVKFIYGPPGTGKTTRLVEILSKIINEAGAHKLNVLVLTPTNKAADVIAEKLFDDVNCHDAVVRFGYTDNSKLINGEDMHFQNRDTMDLDDRDDNIMVATIARYAYDTLQPDNTPICEIDWDYIIVDEASMIDIVPITYLLHKGKGAKFIIAGDPKQITPIPQHNMPTFNIYNMVGLDSFKAALNGCNRFPVEGLTMQHRAIPVIGNLVSDFCYESMVKNDPKRVTPKPLVLDGLNIKPLNFLGFKVQDMDMLYELTQINDSAFHLYSTLFAYNMVKYMVEQIGSKYSEHYSIGIVCPYKAQADAIQQMLENRPLHNDQCDVICGTVHKFQGDECDIMLLVLNPPPKTYSGSHINNMNIINVAMSRARDYIFFLMPERDEDGFQVKDILGAIIDNKNRSIHFCGDVEKIIFGDSDYIYDHTSIQCHQPVNVFYDNRSKYEIRISDTALDIQIND